MKKIESRLDVQSMGLEERIAGRSVLLIDGVESDVPSGGRTASDALLERLKGAAQVRKVKLSPGVTDRSLVRRLCFLALNWPGAVAVILYRVRPHWLWLEWCTRLSPAFALYLLLLRLLCRADIVVLNHHATFGFAPLFLGLPRWFVWHDVPTAKATQTAGSERHAALNAAIERRLAGKCDLAITFSTQDRRRLRRLYRLEVVLAPAVTWRAAHRQASRQARGLLLVGGWQRPENTEGALLFFREYLAEASNSACPRLSFRIAGQGAESFASRLRNTLPGADVLQIAVSGAYRTLADFDEAALLAPITRGAGIKLKTLEAWAAGMPVIGTPQAFTGVPAAAARVGGVRVRGISEVARLCADSTRLLDKCASLRGSQAWEIYAAATGVQKRMHDERQ